MKRHEAALEVLDAVPNLATIARVLSAAADEAAGEGGGPERDPAVRLIAYRLARLCQVDDITYGYDPVTLADTYCTLMKECKARATESTDELVFPLPDLFTPTKRLPFDPRSR
ncbi:hypothetical protein GMLC_21110 [Geomonas limicola]|uniref:Uncharacterized protein n=1 Tax=Geomonas limicola TaxID=2740186 RepID=A0A6V8N7J7_9BACT|nr:hypothetical protein [Geomonas limicola]GFO68532.1 hypothetical protein GMLC_21110 [Geomonas limicola]